MKWSIGFIVRELVRGIKRRGAAIGKLAHIFKGFRVKEVAMLAVVAALLTAVAIHGYVRVRPSSPQEATERIFSIFRGTKGTIHDLDEHREIRSQP